MRPPKKAVRGGRNKVDDLPSDPGCRLRKSGQGRGEKRGLEGVCKGGLKRYQGELSRRRDNEPRQKEPQGRSGKPSGRKSPRR